MNNMPTVITLSTLLEEMVTPDVVARWPLPAFTVKQASSYDRARVAPDKPGWFANNDGSNYIRVEQHDGREEKVMMEADGPGAIVRFHMTSSGALNAPIRIYLDGATTPTLEWANADLTKSSLSVGEPLLVPEPPPGGGEHGAAVLYLPIPYKRHCKVTIEEKDREHPGGRYYHINYRTYSPGTKIETFSAASLDNARPTISRVCQLLENPPSPPTTKAVTLNQMLGAGAEVALDLPVGPSAVRQLELSVGAGLSPEVREQALHSVVIRATFDGEVESIWCPVGDFMGSAVGARPLNSWYRTVDEHGNGVCRWTMPYQKRGRFTLQNLGNHSVQVKMTARSGAWIWDEYSLYFHCNWRQQVQIPARPLRDWNFVTVEGRGVLVGDVLSVYNLIPQWYGEGNEKIWVDGESFPSHVGTGSEDYYNASWAPNPVYQTPFASQPRLDEQGTQGQNVYTRSRNLDTVPFDKSLQFDIEISTWKDSPVDYATTAYWYGAPGSICNIAPQPDEARRPVAVLAAPLVVQNSLEMESLPIVSQTAGLGVETQSMGNFAGTWSGNAHLLVRGKRVGDYVELAIPAMGASPRRVTLYATRAYDYGILKFTVNDQRVDNIFDGYAPNPTPLVPISLGVFTPKDGRLLLRAELEGTNPQSGGDRYLAALDAVVVSPQ